MPFERFMAACLYDSAFGYYAQTERSIGRRGDFFTSVSVGPVFGELLATFVAQTWRDLGEPAVFTLLEQGAHDGRLMTDVLAALRRDHPEVLPMLRVMLIEPLTARRRQQEEALAAGQRIPMAWVTSLDDLAPAPVTGVLLGNELLDAFPVQRWRGEQGAWRELAVAVDETGRFVWHPLPPAAPPFPLPPLAPEETRVTELCPSVIPWMRSLAGAVERGRVLLFDYGREADDYHAPHRADGTLRGYFQHRRCDDPFQAPGETDLTTDVNFTHLRDAARDAGWRALGPEPQERFLTRLARPRLLAAPTPDATWLRQFQTLVHPSQLGRLFHAFVLEQGLADESG